MRGRDMDVVGLQRALYCSSIGEIEYVLGPIVKGKRVVVGPSFAVYLSGRPLRTHRTFQVPSFLI